MLHVTTSTREKRCEKKKKKGDYLRLLEDSRLTKERFTKEEPPEKKTSPAAVSP